MRDPDTRILLDSHDVDSAKKFLQPIKQAFQDKLFEEIHGSLRDKADWSQNSITIKREAILPQSSISLGGVDSSPTGEHYELIISDDLQDEKNSKSRDQIQKVIDRVKLYDNLLDQSGMAVIVGTRWAYGDLMEWLEEQRKEDERFGRPKRIFINKKHAYKKSEDGKFTEELEFPGLLTKEELSYARAQQGSYLFSCNYLVEPMSDEIAVFKKETFQYHELGRGNLPENSRVYMAIDTAGSGEKRFKGADYHGIVISAVSPAGDMYVLYSLKAHLSDQKLMEKIGELHTEYKPHEIAIEANFKRHQLKGWMQDEWKKAGKYIHFDELPKSQVKKEDRIQGVSPRFELGKVYFRKNMTELEDELLQFPKGAHDDLADAFAYTWHMADVPNEKGHELWYMQKDWALTGAFQPTEKMPKPPDPTSIAVWQIEHEERKYKTRNSRNRFRAASRGL